MLLFRSEEHVSRWCSNWNMAPGAAFLLGPAWKLARSWYGSDRRAPDWRRRTLEEAEALLAELGLTGPFWALR